MRNFVFMLCCLLWMAACSSTIQENVQPQPISSPIELDIQKTFVDGIDFDTDYQVYGEKRLIVRGQLPSPAYEFDMVDVGIDSMNIYLTPFAFYNDKKATIQVLIPFERKVTLKLLRSGNYIVHLNGRASTLRKHLFIP